MHHDYAIFILFIIQGLLRVQNKQVPKEKLFILRDTEKEI